VLGLAASYDFGVAKVFYNQTDSRSGNNTVATTAAGYFTGATAAGAGAVSAHTGNSLSLSVPLGATTFKAGFINRKGDSNATIVDRATLGVDYALSKRTFFTAEFGQDKQAVTGANRASNSFVGINHTF
jgi:predicted porin